MLRAWLALALLLLPDIAQADEKTRVLLTEVPREDGLSESTASTLNRVLEGEVRRALPDVELVTLRAVRANLEVAEMADCIGDEETAACASELGNALGADLIVTPRVGRIGAELVFTISIYRLGDATVVGQATRRTTDEGRFLDLVAPAVEEAFTSTGLRVARSAAPGPEEGGPTIWPWLLGGGGLLSAVLAVGVGVLVHGGAAAFLALPYAAGALPRDAARFWEGNALVFVSAGWVLYGVGALLGVGGVTLGLLVE